MASSASRMGRLFTSSSRARSLILTLLIRPFYRFLLRRLAVHTSLVRSGSRVVLIMAESSENTVVVRENDGERLRKPALATVVPVGIDGLLGDFL